ncbi:hypothetical protein FS749_004088 [Ceratobasidium sp. UAMH 11750]|nr:hypothetical protein FS749_004088 [Ceratobasidium sp. UAMH 11750]
MFTLSPNASTFSLGSLLNVSQVVLDYPSGDSAADWKGATEILQTKGRCLTQGVLAMHSEKLARLGYLPVHDSQLPGENQFQV